MRKARKWPLHSCLLHSLVAWLDTTFTSELVEQGATVDLDPFHQLDPDAFVLNKPFRAFPFNHPTPADIRRLVEVSVSTREYDLGPKAARYAAAGKPLSPLAAPQTGYGVSRGGRVVGSIHHRRRWNIVRFQM